MSDTTPESDKASKDELLSELESIKDLLDKHDLDAIPVLDDPVNQVMPEKTHNHNNEAALLDLDNIFDSDDTPSEPGNSDHSHIDFGGLDSFDDLHTSIDMPDFSLSTNARDDEQTARAPVPDSHPPSEPKDPTCTSTINIDLLIQEIVDEFIPAIEAQLRERLTQYPPEIIKQLAHTLNKSG